MKSNCLAETLVPFSGNQATFQHYLVFQNEDHCQVYVPITVLNAKQLEPRHESLILKDLKRKMKITFRHEVPEVSPFSKPGAKFFLKPRSPWSYKSAMKPAYKTRSALRPHPSGMELPSTSWVDTNSAKSAGLSDLQSFVRTFVAKRAELNMGQKDVAKSLKVLYGVHRSSSMISRVERMDLTVSNFLQIYPVLVQWLKDTEDVQSREAIIRAAIDPPTEQKPRKALVTEGMPEVPCVFKVRRPRAKLSTEKKRLLERNFNKNPYPRRADIKELAEELGMDTDVVRVWFYNRRCRLNSKRSTKCN